MMKKNNIVTQAIEATLRDPEGQEWLEGIYRKISFKGGTGSYLPMTPEEVRELIEGADWEIETGKEDEKKTIAVVRGIKGFYRMRDLEDFSGSEELIVAKFHGDKPQLGWVSDTYAGIPTDELRAVCGTDQDGNVTFLVTVLVGDDIEPAKIEAPAELLGKTITVAEAKAFGASYCKVVTSATAKAAKEALAE